MKIGKWYLIVQLAYMFTLLFPVFLLVYHRVSVYREVDPEAVNGIITISTVILGFSFVRLDLWKRGHILLTAVFLTEIVLLGAMGVSYFNDILRYGYPTLLTMIAAMISLLFNLLNWPFIKWLCLKFKIEG